MDDIKDQRMPAHPGERRNTGLIHKAGEPIRRRKTAEHRAREKYKNPWEQREVIGGTKRAAANAEREQPGLFVPGLRKRHAERPYAKVPVCNIHC